MAEPAKGVSGVRRGRGSIEHDPWASGQSSGWREKPSLRRGASRAEGWRAPGQTGQFEVPEGYPVGPKWVERLRRVAQK